MDLSFPQKKAFSIFAFEADLSNHKKGSAQMLSVITERTVLYSRKARGNLHYGLDSLLMLEQSAYRGEFSFQRIALAQTRNASYSKQNAENSRMNVKGISTYPS